ncbi:MAG: hypothetical protein GY771_04000, partial [bacterium]|nr:hypothetical protein [bacterium]
MRGPLIIALMATVLAFAFAASAAENEVSTVTIKFTKAQAKKIANAEGKDVKIKLTDKQINAI